MKRFALLCSLLIAQPSFACQFTTDCEPGSKCIKQSGKLYGYCAGGSAPGNSNDRAPDRYADRSAGKTCSYSTDCDPGYACAKEAGQLDGVCVKR